MKIGYTKIYERFLTMPKTEQVLHIASELQRADHFADEGGETFRNHILRALALLDFLSDDERWQSALAEVRRLRESVASLIGGEKPYGSVRQVLKTSLQLDPGAYRRLCGAGKNPSAPPRCKITPQRRGERRERK